MRREPSLNERIAAWLVALGIIQHTNIVSRSCLHCVCVLRMHGCPHVLSAKLDVARAKAATDHFLGAQSLAAFLDESCDLRSCDRVSRQPALTIVCASPWNCSREARVCNFGELLAPGQLVEVSWTRRARLDSNADPYSLLPALSSTLECLVCGDATRAQRRIISDVMDVQRLGCAESESMAWRLPWRICFVFSMLVVVRGPRCRHCR